MDCEQALIFISAALDGELTEQERQALAEHLEICPECRALSEDMGVLSVALSDMTVAPPDTLIGQVNAALDALEAPAAPPVKKKMFNRKAWGSLAAMFAVVVCLGGVYQLSRGGSSAAPRANETAQYVPTASAPSAAESPTEATYGADRVLESAAGTASEDAGQSVLHSTEETVNSTVEEGIAPESEPEEFGIQETVEEPVLSEPVESAAPEEITADEGGAVQEEPAQPFTSAQAAALIFERLGGMEAYPQASFDEESSSYVLREMETENLHSTLRLDYDGLSQEEGYFTFRQYEYVIQNGADGWAYTVTANRFAVSRDGSELLSEFDFTPLPPEQPGDGETPEQPGSQTPTEEPAQSEEAAAPQPSEAPADTSVES